jgi:hypothetical protein
LRRQQNGKNAIAFKNLIFTGKISEPSLARVLLINEQQNLYRRAPICA